MTRSQDPGGAGVVVGMGPSRPNTRIAAAVLGAAAAVVLLLALATAAQAQPLVRCRHCWHPAVHTTFQIQFSGTLDTSVDAAAYDVDGFETRHAAVRSLRAQGRVPVCYISGGTWENWRPDKRRFPRRIIGRPDAGWAGERWLDIRAIGVLRPLMQSRMKLCKRKGFRAVDVDNVTGFLENTGFHITARQQLTYNRMLANTAHRLGLSIGLKNDGQQARDLVRWFDFAVVEQCFDYHECDPYDRFIAARKPVFLLEYDMATADFCPEALRRGYTAQRKHLNLDAWRETCA